MDTLRQDRLVHRLDTCVRLVLAALLLLIAVPAGAQTADDRLTKIETELERGRTEASELRGEKVFRQSCAACHGRNGLGDGPAAVDLSSQPRNLEKNFFRFRSTPSGYLPRPEDLERSIREGFPANGMPGFGDLFSEKEMADLITYMASLQPPYRREEPMSEPLVIAPVVEAGPSTTEDGRAMYLLVGCWRCHGPQGKGDGPSAKTLKNDDETPAFSTNLRHDLFKRGNTPFEVVRILRTGLNGTPMPSYDEAILLSSTSTGELEALVNLLDRRDDELISRFLAASPSQETIDAFSPEERAAFAEKRTGVLAHYILSLEKSRGPLSYLLRVNPDNELRAP